MAKVIYNTELAAIILTKNSYKTSSNYEKI